MKRPTYRERDYAFGEAMLSVRTTIRLTQTKVAQQLGVSRKTVGEWETGLAYPKAEHLKTFIALALEHQAFPAGREAEEIRTLWQAAQQKVLLDEAWLATLLSRTKAFQAAQSQEEMAGSTPTLASTERGPRVDWGDAPAVTSFYGRERELDRLTSWVVQERCRVVSVLGLGGIGKSVLVVRLMHAVVAHFQVVIWRSLRDAPTCEALLDEYLQVLAPQALRNGSMSLERRLSLLLEHLRRHRVLLVLDNLEAVLEEGQGTGQMRPGYQGYSRLLRRLAETEHQSCLLLTSREKPSDLEPQEGHQTSVRALRLARLNTQACEQLLDEKEVTGNASERLRLIEAYSGNPLALKIAARTIVDLFDGAITSFLEQGEVIFGGVRELLDQQFSRLSTVEQRVLLWLAILREPVSIEQMQPLLVTPLSRAKVLEAIEALSRRSLIEQGHVRGSFTLQSVVLEYVTVRLIAEAASEIEQGRTARLIEHALELATVKEYVRQTQQRLLVAPLLTQIRTRRSGQSAVEGLLLALLDKLRAQADYEQGYGPANLLALLREQRGHLRDLDLSHLAIREAFLQRIEMQDTSLSAATLRDTTFSEAIDAIRAVAISGNGLYWAAGSWQGSTRVWQQEGKILHRAWQAHSRTVSTLAFSVDGRTLATGSWDGAIKLWDVESGNLLWTVWQTNNIQVLAIAPDGRLLASGGNDATIQLWDTHRGTHYRTLPNQSGAVYALAWSPDGSLLASGGLDGVIRLWDLRETQEAQSGPSMLIGHTNWVFALSFAPDGRTLASGSFDRTVKLWDMEERRVRKTLAGHTDKVRTLAWSPDGRMLASGGMDQTIWLWESERGDYRIVLQGHTAAVHALAFTPDNRSLLSGSDDGTLRVWEVASGQCIHILQGYAVSLYDIAWSPDGTHLASASSDTQVAVWEVESQTLLRLLRGHSWIVHGVVWSPDGRLLASCGWDNAIRLWNASTGACVQLLQDPDSVDTLFYGIAWSPDGNFLASGSYQHGIHVWEATTGICRWVSQTPPTIMRRIEWSPDGTYLASCNDEGSVCLWDASHGWLQTALQGHDGMVECIAWSPDGTRLACGGGKGGCGEIVVWDARSWQRQHAWSEPSAMIYGLAWSQTSSVLVSGGSDGMLRWWDVQHEKCVRMRKAHQGTVQSLKASPDGRLLASCGDDNVIHVWNLESGDHLHTLRRDRPYERLNITGVKGLSQAQKETLLMLGAFEETGVVRWTGSSPVSRNW